MCHLGVCVCVFLKNKKMPIYWYTYYKYKQHKYKFNCDNKSQQFRVRLDSTQPITFKVQRHYVQILIGNSYL